MKLRIFLASLLLVLVSFTGCESNHGQSASVGLEVTGKVGEILVVCEQGVWNSDIKACLDSNLTQWILPYLPDVATFTLVHKTPTHFTQGVKRWRNTLFLDIDPSYSGQHGSIVKRPDVWAKGQLVVEVTAKDFNQLLETCREGMPEVHDEFDDMSWRRIMNNFSRTKDMSIRDALKENFGVDLVLPSGSKLVTSRKNFYRIEFPASARPIEFVGTNTQDAGTIFSGIMVYHYDYIDESQMELENLLMSRDTMLKYNVPHEIEGMYMGTQYNEFVYPEGNAMITEDGKLEGYEMRGMFVFTGLPKHGTGGAFWSFHFIHPKTNKVVCVSGYVDAPPTTSWTHPLREVQAVLKSVEIAQ